MTPARDLIVAPVYRESRRKSKSEPKIRRGHAPQKMLSMRHGAREKLLLSSKLVMSYDVCGQSYASQWTAKRSMLIPFSFNPNHFLFTIHQFERDVYRQNKKNIETKLKTQAAEFLYTFTRQFNCILLHDQRAVCGLCTRHLIATTPPLPQFNRI